MLHSIFIGVVSAVRKVGTLFQMLDMVQYLSGRIFPARLAYLTLVVLLLFDFAGKPAPKFGVIENIKPVILDKLFYLLDRKHCHKITKILKRDTEYPSSLISIS